MYTNQDLLYRSPDQPRTDRLYVVTEPPLRQGGVTVVRVPLAAPAAVLDSHCPTCPQQPAVSSVRAGDGSRWLLSGGTLITDQDGRIAVGLRDGNAADPFVLTNIGAGRCDQKLEDHCLEEAETELILCVKQRGFWQQVDFGPHTPPLHTLNKPAVQNAIAAILGSMHPSTATVRPPPMRRIPLPTQLTGRIRVEWYDRSGCLEQETLAGYVFLDHRNHTTEFRLALQLDLSSYDEVRIFFGEGTGYGEWLSLDQIGALAAAEKVARRNLITPFLRAL